MKIWPCWGATMPPWPLPNNPLANNPLAGNPLAGNSVTTPPYPGPYAVAPKQTLGLVLPADPGSESTAPVTLEADGYYPVGEGLYRRIPVLYLLDVDLVHVAGPVTPPNTGVMGFADISSQMVTVPL